MISVVVPIYNVESYLNKCLDSILYQSYQDLEVILVDDGSTDSCPSICDTYAKTDQRVKVIHQENGGLASARNAGIEQAKGEYIAFVDSDDYLLPHMYERMLAAMAAAEAEIVMCSYLNISEDDSYLGVADIHEWSGSGEAYLKTDGIRYNYAWNKLYRKDLFSDLRFPIGKYFEDIFVMHHIFWKARKVSVIPDILYVYRQREGGISKNLVSYHRIDYIEALMSRLRFLVQFDAEESVICSCIMQIYSAWNRFYEADMLHDAKILECWRKAYSEFHSLTQGISHGWTIRNKEKLLLLRIHPQLFRFQSVNSRRIKRFATYGKRSIKKALKAARINRYFDRIKKSEDIYGQNIQRIECLKYKEALNNDGQNLVLRRVESFTADDIVLIRDRLSLSEDPCDPTVLVVVRNERERMKVFYDHYRRLGVHQFVILDNGSDDGTLEFLLNQPDTRVYQTTSKFQTQKKEGWIEKLLALTGYNRWYIVVDSDELLDYIGSEEHSVDNLIRRMSDSGIKRIGGYMLDMYSRESLFSENCEVSRLTEQYRYFDKDGYYTKGAITTPDGYVFGGPRFSKFGTILALGKQPVFYFDTHTLYRDCHSLYPVIPRTEMPCLLVLRHYKFLNKDLEEYHRRVREKNFYNNSREYEIILEEFEGNIEKCLYSEKSCEYINSYSLRGLPYLEEVTW